MRKKATALKGIVWCTVVLVALGIGVGIVYGFTVYLELKKPGVVVLLFHEIIENESQRTSKYQHHMSDFEQQLEYLLKEGYKTILPSEISKYKDYNPIRKIIILTFDDGTPDHYHVVYPLLKRKGIKGVFFVIAGNVGRSYSVSESQLHEMSQNGMEIGSHSNSHLFLDELDEKEVLLELEESKKFLEKAINKNVTSFAPPGGWYNERIVKIAKDIGYTAFFTCEIGVNDISQNNYLYKRIEVLGNMSLDEFKNLIIPSNNLKYKLTQKMKFLVYKFLGSKRYQKLSEVFSVK